MSGAAASSGASLEQLREQALAVLERPEMDRWRLVYTTSVEEAYKEGDIDLLKVVLWYLTEYWDAHDGSAPMTLRAVEFDVLRFRDLNNDAPVAHLVTLESMAELRRFTLVLVDHPDIDKITGIADMRAAILRNPEAGAIMERLIEEHRLTDWTDLEPMLNHLLAGHIPALMDGAL